MLLWKRLTVPKIFTTALASSNTSFLMLIKLILTVVWAGYLARCDWRTRTLPNVGTLGGALVAVAWACGRGWDAGLATLLAGLGAAAFLLLPYIVRAAGAGDVKMLFAAGAIAGPGRVLPLVFAVSVCGVVLAVVMLFARRVSAARLKHWANVCFNFRYDRAVGAALLPPRSSEQCRVPFGIAIGAGLVLTLALEAVR